MNSVNGTVLSASQLLRVDRICDRFEAALMSGQRPRMRDFLGEVEEPERSFLLQELVVLEHCYMAREGGNGPELRGYLDSDLAGQQDFDPSLEAILPTLVGASPIYGGGPSPEQFGDYELLNRIGKGGMGEVFRAREKSTNRIVVLKLVRPDRVDDLPEETRREWQNRLRMEGQAAARLDHDHVVPVYAVGETNGLPYYVMRFVPGQNLSELLRNGPLAPRKAAGYLEPIARAIHHAHEQGILHRDVKPSNILINPNDRPFITDFGLAKWVQVEGEMTLPGTILGSPPYMSPEQIANSSRVSPATDIYGLGATLYHALTGRPPFWTSNVSEVLHQVLHEDPVPPRRLQPSIPVDLETICLKCLNKEPQQRYASAAALAEDLARFLRGETIRARPAPYWLRGWKWVRRYPVVAAALTGGFLMVGMLTVGSWIYNAKLRAAYQEVHKGKEVAKDNFRKALWTLGVLDREMGEADLTSAPHLEKARANWLEQSMHFYKKFLDDHAQDPLVQDEAGWAYSRLGEIQMMLDELAGAEESFRHSLKVLEQRGPSDSDPERTQQRELARTLHKLGMLLKRTHRFAEAEMVMGRVLDIRKEIVQETAETPDNLRDLAASHYYLGAILAPLAGKDREAKETYSQALAIQERLAAQHPQRADYQRELARTLNNYGILVARDTGPEEAKKTFARAIGLQKALVEKEPHVPAYQRELARTHLNFGLMLNELKSAGEAETSLLEARRLMHQLTVYFPTSLAYQQELVDCEHGLASALESLQRDNEALQIYDRAIPLIKKLAEEKPQVPVFRHRWSLLEGSKAYLLTRLDKSNSEAVKRALAQALDLQNDLVKSYPNVPDYQNDLGNTLQQKATFLLNRNNLEEARRYILKARDQHEAVLKIMPGCFAYLRSLQKDYELLGDILVSLGDHQGTSEIAEKMPTFFPNQYQGYLLAADLLAMSIPLVQNDLSQKEGERQLLQEKYARRAVHFLEEAVRRGFADVGQLYNLEVFAPLRSREDFRALLNPQNRKNPNN